MSDLANELKIILDDFAQLEESDANHVVALATLRATYKASINELSRLLALAYKIESEALKQVKLEQMKKAEKITRMRYNIHKTGDISVATKLLGEVKNE